ncbi:MAG: Uma2 family endonuclease [Acidobacteria bacterium]|nr:Uma2 family endonuclease [Acidobacteriota bacterium]
MTIAELASHLPASLTVPGISEDEFLALCDRFPDSMVEYRADGTVTIMPPTDPETAKRVNRTSQRLANWADQVGRGSVVGPDGGFRFPDGSRLAPDTAWFDEDRWQTARVPGVRFPVFAPEFVIELRSPHDKLRGVREKMEDYITNGVQLGWLIDPIRREVTIYRPGRDPEVLHDPKSVAGEGPVEGFVLDLDRILC